MIEFELEISSLAVEKAQPNSKEVLFKKNAFINHQGSKEVLIFKALKKAQCIEKIKFVQYDSVLTSLPKCPYGGFEESIGLDEKRFSSFMDYIIKYAKEHMLNSIIIKNPPSYISPEKSKMIMHQLANHIAFIDINQHINIPSFDPETTPHKMQRRRVIRCMESNFSFQKEAIDSAEEVHTFIAACRKSQGIEINISLPHFLNTVSRFTNEYDMFSIRNGDQIIACSVTVRVSSSIVYNYLPASDSQYSRYSPMVYLITKMIEYYHFKRFTYLDLGISSIHGESQDGLRYFKNRIGAIESEKYTFEIKL